MIGHEISRGERSGFRCSCGLEWPGTGYTDPKAGADAVRHIVDIARERATN